MNNINKYISLLQSVYLEDKNINIYHHNSGLSQPYVLVSDHEIVSEGIITQFDNLISLINKSNKTALFLLMVPEDRWLDQLINSSLIEIYFADKLTDHNLLKLLTSSMVFQHDLSQELVQFINGDLIIRRKLNRPIIECYYFINTLGEEISPQYFSMALSEILTKSANNGLVLAGKWFNQLQQYFLEHCQQQGDKFNFLNYQFELKNITSNDLETHCDKNRLILVLCKKELKVLLTDDLVDDLVTLVDPDISGLNNKNISTNILGNCYKLTSK